MARARDIDFAWGPFIGGLTLYPYQIALGLTLRYWPDEYAPNIRLHLGPVKVWLAVSLRPRRAANREAGGGDA